MKVLAVWPFQFHGPACKPELACAWAFCVAAQLADTMVIIVLTSTDISSSTKL